MWIPKSMSHICCLMHPHVAAILFHSVNVSPVAGIGLSMTVDRLGYAIKGPWSSSPLSSSSHREVLYSHTLRRSLSNATIDFRDNCVEERGNDMKTATADGQDAMKPLIDKHFPFGRFPTQTDKEIIEGRQLGHKINRMVVVSKSPCKHGYPQAFIQKAVTNQQVHSGMVTTHAI